MKGLAIFGIVMIVALAIALQHVANWCFRECQKIGMGGFAVIGGLAMMLSSALILFAFKMAINNPQLFQ